MCWIYDIYEIDLSDNIIRKSLKMGAPIILLCPGCNRAWDTEMLVDTGRYRRIYPAGTEARYRRLPSDTGGYRAAGADIPAVDSHCGHREVSGYWPDTVADTAGDDPGLRALLGAP